MVLTDFLSGFVLSSLFSFSGFGLQDFMLAWIAFQELLPVVSGKVGGGLLARYSLFKIIILYFQCWSFLTYYSRISLELFSAERGSVLFCFTYCLTCLTALTLRSWLSDQVDFKTGLEWQRQLISVKSSMKGGLKMNDREQKYQEDIERRGKLWWHENCACS